MDDVHKEIKHLHDRRVYIPVDPRKMSSRSKTSALKYLIFLKMKRYGRVKGKICADVRSQRANTHKDDIRLTTVATDSLMISCLIDAMERCAVATVDILSALLQAGTDDLVYIKFEVLME